MPIIDYASRDFEAYKQLFLELIKQEFPTWSDTQASNLGMALGTFISMCADSNSFYLDQMVNQVLLPTATLRKYVITGCKTLGYKPYSAKPSKSRVTITITPQSSNLLIPAGYAFSTRKIDEKGTVIRFETDEDLTILAGETIGEVNVTQGRTIKLEYLGKSDGSKNQSFILENRQVIDDTTKIFVKENNILVRWYEVVSLVGLTDQNNYKTSADEIDFTTITFGDGRNGRIPPTNCEIYCTYRVGGGEYTNIGANLITKNAGNLVEIISVTNVIPATGGSDRESIESAKANAILNIKNTEKLVSVEDHENAPKIYLANHVPGKIRTKVLNTGNSIDIYVAVNNQNRKLSNNLKQSLLSYLDERKMIGTIINILDPYVVPIDITVTGVVNDQYLILEVEDLIEECLNDILSINRKDFGKTQTIGEIYKELLNITALDQFEIVQLTTSPVIYPKTQSADPPHTFDKVNVLHGNTLVGKWKVVMTSTTDFDVLYYDTEMDSWENKGSGTIGIEFTSVNSEISFEITSNGGTSSIDDSWEFYTNKFFGNITLVNATELLVPGNYNLILSGGRP